MTSTTRAVGDKLTALFYCAASLMLRSKQRGASVMMLGFGSVEIALAFWLSIGATLLCVVYGIVNWNNSGDPTTTVESGEDK